MKIQALSHEPISVEVCNFRVPISCLRFRGAPEAHKLQPRFPVLALKRRSSQVSTLSQGQTQTHHKVLILITFVSHHSPCSEVATMALDTFFHNKIESMKLEIIQGQAVLRRLEAQRNDYNSRGQLRRVSYLYI